MNRAVELMFESGAFVRQYSYGIIEIYPRKATNSFVFEAALSEISKTHEIVRITADRLRAIKRG